METLLSPDRLQLMPILYPDIWSFYKRAESAFWTVEEVDLEKDRRDFETLSQNEQHFICHILAFFATADGIVFDNIDSNFGEEIQIREAKAFYGCQRFMEGIHNEMYSVMIESLIQDSTKRNAVFEAVKSFPGIIKKNQWALRYMDRKSSTFGERLVAFIIVEYLFFSASFAAIFYFRKRNKMAGLCFSNELISRDEGLHAEFGVLLFTKYLQNKPTSETVLNMVRAAVEIELEFVTESLPVNLMGMSCDAMSTYVKFVADHMLTALGQDKYYNVCNPFEWMELISLQDKTNFFEKRVSAYSKAGVGDTAEEIKFDLNSDF